MLRPSRSLRDGPKDRWCAADLQSFVPRVSVLFTCYNHIRFLPEAWQSALDQTFTDWEIVAIDDGSTDGTRDWLSDPARVSDRTQVILNEQNLGTYGSLNRALASAKGEFIAILNDDDVWAPRKLEAQLELFEKHPEVGLVHTDGWFIDGEGVKREDSPLGFEFPRFETGDILSALLYQNKIIASAALVRKECFDRVGGFNEAYFGSGDWEMWLRIAEHWPLGCVAEPLTFYRVHGANASHKLERIWKDDQMLREWIATKEAPWMARGDAAMGAAFAHNYAALGTVKTLNGDPAGGRRAYMESIRRSPGRFKSYLRWAATFLPRSAFRKLL